MQSRILATICALGLLAAGCGGRMGPVGPRAYPVQGKVIYQGKPANGFRVIFHPLFDLGKIKFAPSATTDANGVFHLRSYVPGDGAPAGEYAVTIEWPGRPTVRVNIDDDLLEIDQLQGAYANPQESKWKIQVREGRTNLEPFEIN